jgi:hypothetical protein
MLSLIVFEGLAGVGRGEFVIHTTIKKQNLGGGGGVGSGNVNDDDDDVKCGWEANNHDAVATMMAAATMKGGCWCQCKDVTISHNKVMSNKWQQRLRWWMRGCSGSCICGQEACCCRTGNHGKQEAPADGNGEGSDNDNNEGNKKSEGGDGNGNKGDDGNFPEGGGRRWPQQSTRY